MFPVAFDNVNCTTSLEHLLAVHRDYVPLWDINASHFVCGVRSQFNLSGWRNMLAGGAGEVYGPGLWDVNAHFLLDGICHGFKLVDPGVQLDGYFCKNYDSAAIQAKSEIDVIIRDEVESGKLSVVSTQPLCVHAMGAVVKSSGGIRPITDASRPENLSINQFMSQTFKTFSYKSVDTVSDSMSENCFMAVTDITAAYRSVLVRPSDRTHQGLVWDLDGESCYIQDNCLSFGTRVSPYVFNSITDAVSRYVSAHGIFCVNYLDDFLVMGQDYESCRSAQLFLHSVLRSLGFYIAYKKVRSPSRIQVYLGVELDSTKMELRLPQEKLDKLYVELDFFSGRRRATKKQLQRLCGVLSHCSTLVRGGRTFSHRVISLLSAFTPKKRYITLSHSFHQDLQWWHDFAAWFNGSAKIIQPPTHTTMVCTDASGSGFGAYTGIDWICGQWYKDIHMDIDNHSHCVPQPDIHIPVNINVRELYPVLEAIKRWGHLWTNHRVQCVSDNTQVVAAVNTGRSSNAASMVLLRQIFWHSIVNNFHLVGVYLPGRDNVVADAISRASSSCDLPAFLCCRGGEASQGPRSEGSGATESRLVAQHLENEGFSVEKVH